MQSKEKTDLLQLKAKLHKKILLVTKEIGLVRKDGRNSHQGYDFISHYAMSSAARQALIKNNLSMCPSIEKYNVHRWEVEKIYKGQKTIQNWMGVDLTYSVQITDAETGFSETFTWSGYEQDSAGKAFQQAISAAYKYFMFKLFNVTDKASSNDNDSNSTQINGKIKSKNTVSGINLASEPQIERLKELIKGLPVEEVALKAINEGLTALECSKLITKYEQK